MQVKISGYLLKQKPLIKELVTKLTEKYGYVSVLGTDTSGKSYKVQRTGIEVNDSRWVERGFVVRVHNGINYSEYSFNQLEREQLDQLITEIERVVQTDVKTLQAAQIEFNQYPVIEEEALSDSFYGEIEVLPDELSPQAKIERMSALKEQAFAYSDRLIDFRVMLEEVHISKIFISVNKDLEQSYIWSQANLVPIVRRDQQTKYYFEGFSGLKGSEILTELAEGYQEIIDKAVSLLDAERVEAGIYDVICSPDVAGLIAHEAFGHGVEMDMFVKNRAKAVEYLGKPIASKLVTMHDGAATVKHVSSYLFDDEGTLAGDTVVIEQGILKSGISDLLSALYLGTTPTGNGKRQSFERKSYARMTNTIFAPGTDRLEDMIASLKYGYLLEGMMSGMEDPKNWGIQCMLMIGKEIRDGEFTGKIISPVIMTGYVPDLLKSISMVSDQLELFGSGACGKGYKEFVKVSDGGPYLKTKARLG